MDEIDVVLTDSNPYATVPEVVSILATEQAISQHRLSRRRGWFTVGASALIAGLVIGGGGGVAAATAAGWIGRSWVDGADRQGVREVTVSDGTVYACPYAFHFEGDFQQPQSYKEITESLAEAHSWARTFDPLQVKMNPKFESSPYTLPGESKNAAEARSLMNAWEQTIFAKVQEHLKAKGLPGVDESYEFDLCAPVSTK